MNIQIGGEVHHHNITAEENIAPRTSIDNVGHVTPHFIESESYLKAKKHLEDKIISVLHLHGMPGSGKSEIVRKLGADFANTVLLVKYHIQCSDKNHKVKTQLKQLVNLMVKKGLLVASDAAVSSATDNMNEGSCKEYVNLLASSNCPILIIIEDPTGDKFLEGLLMSVTGIKDRKHRFHIYITSHMKTTCTLPTSSAFYMQEVAGFTISEGFDLLEVTQSCQEEEQVAAKQIISRLSGSPLGLWAVKKARLPLSYVEYLRHMESKPLFNIMLEREKEKLEIKHLYTAILFLLSPKENKPISVKHWQAICALAFLHNGNVPQILIGRVMQYIREDCSTEEDIDTSQSLNRWESEDFIQRLLDYGLCKVDGTLYIGTRVTFHAVVFSAVKIHLQTKPDIYSSARDCVTKCLTGIVHKDLRLTQNHLFMIEMVPHIRSILEEEWNGDCSLMMQFCYAHLYEVRGAVLAKQPKKAFEAEEYLIKSVGIWITVIRSVNKSDISLGLVTMNINDTTLQKRVQEIVDEGANAGRKLMACNFDIEQYISLVLQPKSNELDFYLEKSNEEVKAYLQKALTSSIPLHPSKLRQFTDMKMQLFLDRTKLFETYIAERITSVLHTISLLIKNNRDHITEEVRKKSEFFSKFAIAICDEVQKRFEIAPLFMLLSTRGSVRIKLTTTKLFQGRERRNFVVETKRFIQENLMENKIRQMFFYEHGICKQPQEIDYLRHQHQVTRINTKLIALGPEEDLDVAEADEQCESLYHRAMSNKKWSICIRCIVYCGKYWASRGDFEKAVKIFDEALECDGIRSPSEVVRSFPWVCFNHARAVLEGKMVNRALRSKELCEEALKMWMSFFLDLKRNLERILTKLDEMILAHSDNIQVAE